MLLKNELKYVYLLYRQNELFINVEYDFFKITA